MIAAAGLKITRRIKRETHDTRLNHALGTIPGTISGLVLAASLWWGPGGSRLRSPLNRVVIPVARSGGLWVAYYAMQRQQDGSWRTHGCRLVQPSRIISA